MPDARETFAALYAAFNARDLDALLRERPAIATAFGWARLIDEAVLRSWIVGLGRRTAFERTAHLMCELQVRLDAVGLAGDGFFPWPLTQDDLADTLGLTAVHVNRTLQRLRAEVERTCEDVGADFAQEARRIHTGESEHRGIYGEATPEQAEALADEGIEVARIPWVPRADG